MTMKAHPYDEVQITIAEETRHFLYVDYNDDGGKAFWPHMTEAEKWLCCCTLLRLLEEVLPPPFAVKMLSTEAWCAKMLEESIGDPPIKDEPPF